MSTAPSSKGWIFPSSPGALHSESASTENFFSPTQWKQTYRHAQAVARTPADAEDIAQEAFLRLHKAVASGQRIESLTAWMKSVVRRVAVDHFRTARPDLHIALESDSDTPGSLTEIADSKISAEDRLAKHSILQASLRVLSEMPDRDRECVMMYARGCTFVQIANVLNIPYEVAIKTTRKALVKTRRRLVR